MGSTSLVLRLCRWPMKSQVREGVAIELGARPTRSWARFSPTSADARLEQRAHVLRRQVLGTAQQDLDVARLAAGGPGGRVDPRPRRRHPLAHLSRHRGRTV